MGRRRAVQRDGKKVGLVKEWEEGGRGRGMEKRDGTKVGMAVALYLLVL